MAKEEILNVLPGNEYLVERFIREVYGSPHFWSGGEGLIVEGYPALSIESRKEIVFRDEGEYKTRVVLRSVHGKIKDKLTYLAETKGLHFFDEISDIEKIAKEEKSFEYLMI